VDVAVDFDYRYVARVAAVLDDEITIDTRIRWGAG
jgi:hypothetical protein